MVLALCLHMSADVSGVQTTYLYDGQNLIRETGAATADYLIGPGIDEPLAMSRGGSVYYYDVDGLGSATLVNNSTGTMQDSYVLDAWGIARSQTAAVANPFTYTSREAAEAGLMFYRARYYNTGVGRFVSEDRLRNSEKRLYAYTNNVPTILTDPSGNYAPGQIICRRPSGGAGGWDGADVTIVIRDDNLNPESNTSLNSNVIVATFGKKGYGCGRPVIVRAGTPNDPYKDYKDSKGTNDHVAPDPNTTVAQTIYYRTEEWVRAGTCYDNFDPGHRCSDFVTFVAYHRLGHLSPADYCSPQ